ncbi:hypothetical protein [Lacipirellula limnantheis]|uniref:Uncharacterized protein n=1 Tax=Lacipirellula limnantheis TaxID=2528024 RepID=A0A517TTP8_9BACT|nr:hypothetical protein [Lacipirellula limnantheis]QDT71750.1 hypothetical protein I41_09100 [Lacipirellula limnantheis]
MIATNDNELRRRWRRQVSSRSIYCPGRAPREGVALGFLIDGWRRDELVELRRLTTIVLFDERAANGRTSIRVLGYRPELVGQEILWTGPQALRLRKDLALPPRPLATGRRLDSRRRDLLELALRLDHRLSQAQRRLERLRHTEPRFPRVWAGFRPSVADQLISDAEQSPGNQLDLASLLAKLRREQDGLSLLPADWIGDDLPRATALFAEQSGLPARQAINAACDGRVPVSA